MAKNSNGKTETFEKTVFKAADKFRKNINAAEGLCTPQIQTLSKLRDELLPKLMKVEIRVKDTVKSRSKWYGKSW